jgi:Growth regulator
MEAVIRKWGNSLGVRIPSSIAKDTSIIDGSHVDIEDVDGQIIIRPKNRYNLKDMIREIKTDNIHEEVKSNGPVGNEIW